MIISGTTDAFSNLNIGPKSIETQMKTTYSLIVLNKGLSIET